MIKIFETLEKYNTYTNNGQNLESGDLYYVKEDNSTHYLTNNIDGVTTIFDTVETPTGNIEITANGENIDVAPYSTASVSVPIPEGYIKPSGNKEITANGENIDVNSYATASVSVPIPEGYILPTGNKEITANGTGIDVKSYATASVNVPQPTGNISITENGEGIDVSEFATATVAVPQPTGNISITENGENIDIAQYATATVNVPSGTEDLKNLIERDITSITIPSGTTTIGTYAFYGCGGLTSVTIPNSVNGINNYCFNNCTSLAGITIPSTLTYLGNYCFQRCTSFTSVGVVGSGASIEIPNGVTEIKMGLFKDCTGLTSVTMPSGVTKIEQYSFTGCTGLTSVTIPNSVTSIGGGYASGAFYNCTSLTQITIPNSVTNIGQYAFSGCTSLTSVTINATTPPTLGSNAFSNTNDCPIYVPEESLEAYRAAANWSSLGLRIQTAVIIDVDEEAGGTGNELYTIADTVVDGEPGARITANDGQFVGYYNSEEEAYYDTEANWIDMAEYNFDFSWYLEDVYGIE